MQVKSADVVIVGAGPAGMTAALYLIRAGLEVVMFDPNGYGGQMANAPLIENYPGFCGSGFKLADKMWAPLEAKVELFYESVQLIQGEHPLAYKVIGTETAVWCDYLIIATGGKPKTLNIPGIDKPHVHYCATCDGPLYEGKEVAVVGDGNSALQYAIELSHICEKVHICAIGSVLHGEKCWKQRVTEAELRGTIQVHWNFDTAEITDYGICSGDGRHIFVDGVFIAIGYDPIVPEVEDIYIPITNKYISTTTLREAGDDRIYAIGDVVAKPFRQVASAVNDGMIAALSIIEKITKGE